MFSFASSKWSLQLWNHVSILHLSQFSKRHVLNQIQNTWSYEILHIFMNDCKDTTLYFTITQKWHVIVTKLITNILDHTYTTSYVTFPQHNFPSCPKFLRYMETPNSHAQYNIHCTLYTIIFNSIAKFHLNSFLGHVKFVLQRYRVYILNNIPQDS